MNNECYCNKMSTNRLCDYCEGEKIRDSATYEKKAMYFSNPAFLHTSSLSIFYNDLLPEDATIKIGCELQCGNKAFRGIFMLAGGNTDSYADFMLIQAKNRFEAWLDSEHLKRLSEMISKSSYDKNGMYLLRI